MKDQKADIEIYLKEKIVEYLKTSSSLYQQVVSNQDAIKKIEEDLRKIKKIKGEEGFGEAQIMIITMQELHYNMFLLDQSVKQLQVIIYEFSVISKLFGIEIDIEEDASIYYDTVSKTSPHIFVVEKGQVEMIKNDMTDKVMEAIGKKMHSQESLKRFYEMIPVE